MKMRADIKIVSKIEAAPAQIASHVEVYWMGCEKLWAAAVMDQNDYVMDSHNGGGLEYSHYKRDAVAAAKEIGQRRGLEVKILKKSDY